MLLRRIMFLFVTAVAGFFAAGSIAADRPVEAPTATERFVLAGTVVKVVDGDTLDVRLPGKRKLERVRLLGIDAPQLRPLECFGIEARAEAGKLAQGKRVRLIGDRTQAMRDRYQRLLAYVVLPNGTDLGQSLIRRGFGKVFLVGRPFSRVNPYREAQRRARGVPLGLWSGCGSGGGGGIATTTTALPPLPPPGTTSRPTTTAGTTPGPTTTAQTTLPAPATTSTTPATTTPSPTTTAMTTTTPTTTAVTTTPTTTSTTTTITTTTTTPLPPAAPPPIVVSGRGDTVETVTLAANRPVVVSGEHNGSSNFIVRLVGPSDTFGQLLFNEIGGYQGETAWPDAKAISYKLAVQADGAWSIRLTQPVPTPDAIPIPGTVQGQGDKVVAIRATSTMQATVTGSNTGSSNFIVRMYGYGSTAGYWQLVFNEIGPYQGQRLVSIPAGPYLLHVLSNGNWSIGFAR